MEGIQLPIPRRMIIVRSITIISMIVSVLLSLPLWGGQRYFPKATLLQVPDLLAPWDYILPFLFIVLLILGLLGAYPRFFLTAALSVLAWMVLNDVNRLQEWTYVYAGLLLVFIFYDGRVDDSSKFTSYFIVLQFVLAACYFFTGLHQLNTSFTLDVLPELIKPLNLFLSPRQFSLMVKLGNAVPYFLMFIGVGLIVSPVRYLAITLAVLLHLCLLFFIFPGPDQLNYAQWFSNISFLVLVFFLFSGKTKQRYYSPTFLFQLPVFYLMITFYVVFPFLNFQNRWPDVLSFNVGTGSQRRVQISTGEQILKKLSLYEPHFYKIQNDRVYLDYVQWCREELHAEPFSDDLGFNSIYQYLRQIEGSDVKETEMRELPRERFLGKP